MPIAKPPFEREHAEQSVDLDFFRCYIKGEPWRYALVTSDQMKILLEDPSKTAPGLCDTSGKIYIEEGNVIHPVVIHELCHAHVAQSQTAPCNLSTDQIEELMCEIFAKNWMRILMQARVVVHNLIAYEHYIKGQAHDEWIDCQPDIITERFPENLLDLVATYTIEQGENPLLKPAIAKKKRPKALQKTRGRR